MSEKILMIEILEKLAVRDDFGRYEYNPTEWRYSPFYDHFAYYSNAAIDDIMKKMHKAELIDLIPNGDSEQPFKIKLRLEGFYLLKHFDI